MPSADKFEIDRINHQRGPKKPKKKCSAYKKETTVSISRYYSKQKNIEVRACSLY